MLARIPHTMEHIAAGYAPGMAGDDDDHVWNPHDLFAVYAPRARQNDPNYWVISLGTAATPLTLFNHPNWNTERPLERTQTLEETEAPYIHSWGAPQRFNDGNRVRLFLRFMLPTWTTWPRALTDDENAVEMYRQHLWAYANAVGNAISDEAAATHWPAVVDPAGVGKWVRVSPDGPLIWPHLENSTIGKWMKEHDPSFWHDHTSGETAQHAVTAWINFAGPDSHKWADDHWTEDDRIAAYFRTTRREDDGGDA